MIAYGRLGYESQFSKSTTQKRTKALKGKRDRNNYRYIPHVLRKTVDQT